MHQIAAKLIFFSLLKFFERLKLLAVKKITQLASCLQKNPNEAKVF